MNDVTWRSRLGLGELTEFHDSTDPHTKEEQSQMPADKNTTLPVTASRDDIEAYLKSQHQHGDWEPTKDDVDNIQRSLVANRSYRQSLDPISQVELASSPGIAPALDPDNPPAGVTVVDRGKSKDDE